MTQELQTKQRNEKRRQRYQSDDAYREQYNSRNLQNYRDQVGGVELRDCSANIDALRGFGTVREIVGTGDSILTFNAKEAAQVLDGYNEQFVYRCLRDGRLPPMVVEALGTAQVRNGTRAVSLLVYTEGEMRAVAKVMAAHQQKFSYYRQSHTETRNALYAALDEFRG